MDPPKGGKFRKRAERSRLRTEADRIGISYIFDLGKDPAGKVFHYETPVSIVENEVEFVLRDIPLP